MIGSKTVSGRVIEQRGNVVITVQGGLVSSYDLRYYSLPAETDAADTESNGEPSRTGSGPDVLLRGKRYAFWNSSERGSKKSAHRA